MSFFFQNFFQNRFAFAFGDNSNANGFIGSNYFALSGVPSSTVSYAFFFFQLCFAATASTIVSGGAAGRCTLLAYGVYTVVISGFTYPIVSHWCWSSTGWLSPVSPGKIAANGFIDFAGSTVVHVTGGISSLVASILLGPRIARHVKFDQGDNSPIQGHSKTLQQIGTVILLFGWMGFNPGSTLKASGGASQVAARVAVTTLLSGASGLATGSILGRIFDGNFGLSNMLNCMLAGLVGITSGCATVYPWAAIVIGIIGRVSAFRPIVYMHSQR